MAKEKYVCSGEFEKSLGKLLVGNKNKDKFDQNRWSMSKVRKVGQLYEFHFYK